MRVLMKFAMFKLTRVLRVLVLVAQPRVKRSIECVFMTMLVVMMKVVANYLLLCVCVYI